MLSHTTKLLSFKQFFINLHTRKKRVWILFQFVLLKNILRDRRPHATKFADQLSSEMRLNWVIENTKKACGLMIITRQYSHRLCRKLCKLFELLYLKLSSWFKIWWNFVDNSYTSLMNYCNKSRDLSWILHILRQFCCRFVELIFRLKV